MNATVYCIGSGPGDLELLTLKGRYIVDSADVIVYGRLPVQSVAAECTSKSN